MDKKLVWLDTDVGVDDAFALLTALKLPNIELVGISAVFGNVELEKTFKNVRDVLSLAQREDIKVYKGLAHPFIVPNHYAHYVHGENGLGDIIIPESKAAIETKNAIEAMYECAKKHGKIYLVAIGPLTNVATAIINYPDFLDYIEEIDIMGGSIGYGGNVTSCAEFNIYCDPHAAQTVFMSGAKINLFPLDVTMKALLKEKEINSLGLDNSVTRFLNESSKIPMNFQKTSGHDYGLYLHDTCPLVYLYDPTLFKGKEAGVYVETQAKLSLGKTVSDIFVKADVMFDKNATIFIDVDRDRLAKTVIDNYKKY